ncbi:DUF1963 domain-containing protein [Paenibacillus athensensis]|nr:YwqG family protein [Paenibacillus athensensis]MCD1257261.1 DUF1963 domain-containing protein [Paenibacillus athensensis]
MMEWKQVLDKLGTYRTHAERSVRPYVEITAHAGATAPWMSKFGGSAYMAAGQTYPLDAAGKPMRLLAQINLAELPRLDLFPESGLLQFFIAASDDLHGLSFDDPCDQRNFKVTYVPEAALADALTGAADSAEPATQAADEAGREAAAQADSTDGDFPLARELALSLARKDAAVSSADYQFERFFGEEPFAFFEQFGDEETELSDAYADACSGIGHKIGGYAFFTQSDPREGRYEDYEVLLLQIDSDHDNGIMWGDSGVANFFIRPADLQNRDFSKVLYNWDCY